MRIKAPFTVSFLPRSHWAIKARGRIVQFISPRQRVSENTRLERMRHPFISKPVSKIQEQNEGQ